MKKHIFFTIACAGFVLGIGAAQEEGKSGWFPWLKDNTPYYDSTTQMKIEQNEMEQKQVQMKIQQLEQQKDKAEERCEQTEGYAKGPVCEYSDQAISSKDVEGRMLRRRLNNLQKKHTELTQKRDAELMQKRSVEKK